MRRLLPLLLVLMISATMGAQEKLRIRWRGVGLVSVPNIAILGPTLDPTLQTPDSTITLTGTAEDADGIVDVTWSCATCTPTSGTASGTTTWTISGTAASATTVVQDNFNEATTVDLASHTPTPVGTSWAEAIDTSTTNSVINHAGGYIRPNLVDTAGTNILAYLATPDTAITGTNYDVSATVQAIPSSSNQRAGLMVGYVDSSNYCGVLWRNTSTALTLFKRVAGTTTALGTSAAPIVAGDVVRVEVRGSSLEVFQNGNSQITATDSACDNASGVGVVWGAVFADDDITPAHRLDDFEVVDQDAGSSGGLALAVGANTIEVEACNTSAICRSDTIVVTRVVTDSEDPTIAITQPTTSATYATSTAAITVAGIAADNVGVDAVTWACPQCTPTSGTATGTESWTFNATLGSGANTITVTATDTEGNDAADVLTATLNSSDTTDPTITITTNGGSNFSTANTSTTIAGTASDNVAVTSVQCANAAGGVQSATGTTSWSVSLGLVVGSNAITCTAFDEAGNDAVDTITVTRTIPDLVITSAATLLPATQNSAYSLQLVATGGTAPYSWTNNGAGTTLNDGDAQCAGLSVNSSGLVSGTPTQTGTCSWTSRVQDSQGSPDTDTQAHTLVINAPGSEGPHDFFNDLLAHDDLFTAYSLRPQAGQPISHPDYALQLANQGVGGFQQSSFISTETTPRITYNPGADTDAHKQDAAKVVITGWQNNGVTGAALNSSEQWVTAGSPWNWSSLLIGKPLRIDDEIMTVAQPCQGCNPRNGNQIFVTRGQFGTTAASHASGATVEQQNNSLTTQLRIPVLSDKDNQHTYLFVWDFYMTDSWIGAGATIATHKNFQIGSGNGNGSDGAIWMEQRVSYNNAINNCCNAPGFDPALHVGSLNIRSYLLPCGSATYANTDGQRHGPNAVGNNQGPLRPAGPGTCPDSSGSTGKFIVHPNRWTRLFVKILSRPNDYDLISFYANDEQQNTVTIFEDLQVSIYDRDIDRAAGKGNQIRSWWIEMNTSLNDMTRPDGRDWVMYVRNFAVLEDAPSGDITTLLARKPVGGS